MPKNTPIRIIDNAPRRAASFLGGGGNTSINDHGLLGGLNDDDHIFYHNDARGDVRYVPLGRTVTAGDGLNVYSTVKDTASKNNLYFDAASSEYRLQNNTGSSRTYSIFSVRTRATS